MNHTETGSEKSKPKKYGGQQQQRKQQGADHLLRLTDPEIRELDRLKEKYGLTRSDLIRKFLLEEKGPLIVNLKEFLEGMSELAAEQGRVNNNINQLARHANQSLRPDQTNPLLFARFNELMGKYLEYQRLMNGCFKKIYRSICR